MSFADVASGARELRPVSPQSQEDKAARDLSAAVFRLQTDVTRLKNDVDKLGTPRDTVALRARIGEANQRISSSAKEVKERLVTVAGSSSTLQMKKLVRDFEVIMKDYQDTLKVERTRELQSLPRPDTSAQPSRGGGAGEEEQRALLEARAQEQAQVLKLQGQLEYNEAIIEERDQGVAEIQGQINDVAQIFQDLAVLVHDQGEMIDDIEANISNVAASTKEAGSQLVRAERSQRGARNKRCCLMLLAAIVLGVLLLVLLM